MLVSRFANFSSRGLSSAGVVPAGTAWTGYGPSGIDSIIDSVTDTAGRTYILSAYCNLMVIDVDGNLMAQFSFIAPPATLYATALAIDTSGYVYVLANDNAFANFLYRVVFNGTIFTQQWGKTWTDNILYTKLAFNSTYSIMHAIGTATSSGQSRIQIVDVDSTLGTYKRLTRIFHTASYRNINSIGNPSCYNGTLTIVGCMQAYVATSPAGFAANRGFIHTCACTSAGVTLAGIASTQRMVVNGGFSFSNGSDVILEDVLTNASGVYIVGNTTQQYGSTYIRYGYVELGVAPSFPGNAGSITTQNNLQMFGWTKHIMSDITGLYMLGDDPTITSTVVALLNSTTLIPIGSPTALALTSSGPNPIGIYKVGTRLGLVGKSYSTNVTINSLPSNLSIPASTWTINGLTYNYSTAPTTNSPGTLLASAEAFTTKNNATLTFSNSTLVPTATTKIWNRQNI